MVAQMGAEHHAQDPTWPSSKAGQRGRLSLSRLLSDRLGKRDAYALPRFAWKASGALACAPVRLAVRSVFGRRADERAVVGAITRSTQPVVLGDPLSVATDTGNAARVIWCETARKGAGLYHVRGGSKKRVCRGRARPPLKSNRAAGDFLLAAGVALHCGACALKRRMRRLPRRFSGQPSCRPRHSWLLGCCIIGI